MKKIIVMIVFVLFFNPIQSFCKVIDAWNMTREVVAQNVCGRVQIKLPGREDMAVLALRQ